MNAKEQIISAAHKLFANEGYEQVSINQIIKEANVSRGGFYHHFESKEALLKAIMMTYFSPLESELKELVSKCHLNCSEQLLKVFQIFYTYKLRQVQQWTELHKLFNIKNNRYILFEMNHHLEELLKDTHLSILNHKSSKVPFPEPIAAHWTNHFINLYGHVKGAIFKDDTSSLDSYLDYTQFYLTNLELDHINDGIREIINNYVSEIRRAYLD